MSKHVFFVCDPDKLKPLIAKTGQSISSLASAGRMNAKTFKKALTHQRMSEAKANGVVNALRKYDVIATFEELFKKHK